MSYYDNIIIGGGVSGLGALTSLVSSDKSTGGNDTVVLFEARESLMYTNTWMKNVQVQDSLHGSHTGESFRKVVLKDITESKAEACIYTGRRVYHVDQASRTIHLRSQAGEQEAHTYGTLIVAVGGAQILYGRYLLPGSRGGRYFTTYQVGEMIEHYPFLPGHRLLVFGESVYSLETALLAKNAGMSVTVVSPSNLDLPDPWPDDIPVYHDAVLKQVYGDTLFEGMLIQVGSAQFSIPGDSIAVDGDFVLEHAWREHLGVEWNLNTWELDLSLEEMQRRHLFVVGDALRPDPDFAKQYELGRYMARELGQGGEASS